MDWLKDGIVDYLVGIYTDFFSGVDGLYTLAQTSPSTWHDGVLWNAVTGFNENAVLPIAWSIMSLFLLLELASLFKRSDARGLDGIYWIAQIFLKIGIAKLVMDNMDMIIGAIFEVTSTIVSNGSTYITASGSTSISSADKTALADAFADRNVLELLGYFIIGLLLQLAQKVCFLLCNVVIQLRFIEIYAFLGLCALPFATLPSQEYSQIGKQFIKRMVGLALHVVFICIVLFMYITLIKSDSFTVSADDPLGALFNAFGYTLLMVVALFQTGGWAKSLAGAN